MPLLVLPMPQDGGCCCALLSLHGDGFYCLAVRPGSLQTACSSVGGLESGAEAMPFLETANFREWEDDGNWEPVNAAGAFRGQGTCLREGRLLQFDASILDFVL